MKRYYRILLPIFVFTLALSASAQQVKTWICPQSSAQSYTNTLAANQIMELLSGSFEPDSQIEIRRGTELFLMGNGGANINTPFVIAGPAIVTFRKTATGGQGTIISYRISQQMIAPEPKP